jgi:hypothetical protein
MTKLYKRFANACRFTNSQVKAVTLDGVKGFMPVHSLRPVREIEHDTIAWMPGCKRHFLTAKLPDGLLGFYLFYDYLFDDVTSRKIRPREYNLFSTEQATS